MATTQEVETLIIGAGPGGLACAHTLAQAGEKPVVVERGICVGGLMRSVERGGFSVDLGRKELYSRIEDVDQLWTTLLGEDYIPYEHREGILFKSRIFETSTVHHRLRGFTASLALHCAIDMGVALLTKPFRTPGNYEDYWHGRRGRTLSRVLSQGYEEKFNGIRWADMPVPDEIDKSSARTPASTPSKPKIWRHPALGSGQIPRSLADAIVENGGVIQLSTDVSRIDLSGGKVDSVIASNDAGEVIYRPRNVVSSLPATILAPLLNLPVAEADSSAAPIPRRGTVLVYLYTDTPPRFPHNWLRVTCPELKAGRIVNYASFGGRMVPPGKTCLCVEYFCRENDTLLQMSDTELRSLALQECESAQLLHSSDCTDYLVLTLPMADAATSWRDWRSPLRTRLCAAVQGLSNLIDIGRPGTDKATAAGLYAARAIMRGDCSHFEQMAQAIDGPISS